MKTKAIKTETIALAAAGAAVLYCIHKKKTGVSGIGRTDVWELPARWDSRASFYGKAQVMETPAYLTLLSYNTEVAKFNKKTGLLKVYGCYSNTTARHIREFARACGINLGKVEKGEYYA